MRQDRGRYRKAPRRARVISALLAAGLLLPAGVVGTWAAFTDEASLGLGSSGSVGGTFDIALMDPEGNVQQGNPAYILDTTGAGAIKVVGSGSAKIEVPVLMTTELTGPVVLTLFNAYSGVRPADPGSSTAAEPYDVALFTVSVDGVTRLERRTASEVNASSLTLIDWNAGVPKAIEIAIEMPTGLANPYYFNRTLILGLHFDGMSQ